MLAAAYENIQEFLGEWRFAIIGVSKDPKHFTRSLFKEFLKHEYDVIPVNPNTTNIDGRPCFQHIGEVQPLVSQAMITTPKSVTLNTIQEAESAGLQRVWIYGISGQKDVAEEVLEFGRNSEMDIIPGFCPFMFLPNAAFFHKIHGAVWKMLGKYPAT